jgi:hypothetical protein
MELKMPVPESSEGYELVELPPEPSKPAPAPAPDLQTLLPQAPNGSAAAKEPEAGAAAPKKPKAPKRKSRKSRSLRWDVPAWGVSVVVHAAVLSLMALMTLAPAIAEKLPLNLNTALVDTRGSNAEPESLPILADPANMPREEAAGSSVPTMSQGIGTGAPSATPVVRVGAGGAVGAVSERSGLPGVQVVAQISGLSMLPAAPAVDLGGGGMIAGDVTYEATDVGAALDQHAREILRHLESHKLTVVVLFFEKGSIK